MPTYEYECKTCGHTFEAFQSMSDDPLKICPKCGKEIRRLIHGGTGIIFKGSGFYVTDKGKGSSAGAPGKNAKPAEAASSGSPDKTPAASGDGAAKGGDPGSDAKKSDTSGGESASKKTGSDGKPKPAARTA